MTPTKMKLRMRKKEGGAKSSRRLLTETSPDSKCPICLDRFNNVASLDRCLHRFCFRCIHEWSKNKAECPLCKQPFRSIFHSVKAENDFKEFVLAPVENGPTAAVPPPANQTESSMPSGRVRRPRAQRGGERRSRRNQNVAPATTALDVRLEGLAEEVDQERGVHHMMLRLTERRRSRVEEHSLRRLRDQDVVAFRRALYRTGVRVRNVGWDSSRQRDISATHLRRNPACLRRLLPWLQRELTVLYGSHGSLVSIVQHIIMSRITHYDMDDAAIRDELRPFLLARTDHFLHELVSFARSTLSIEAYDQQAVYECPAPSYEEDSSSNSSIIAISEDDDSEEADITQDTTQECVPPVPMATGGESSLSQSAWDDETPGPSYSTLLPSPSQSQTEGAEHNSASAQANEGGDTSGAAGLLEDEEEECMIVGYVKPMAERTPELVQLSSDSSEEEEEAADAEKAQATVPKVEASSSQVQVPPSPESYLTPVSPSSFPCPSASRSPLLNVDSVSPHNATLLKDSPVKDGERQSRPGRKEHNPQHAFRSRSRSSSESSVLSGHSGHTGSRRHSFSASRHRDQPNHQETQRWNHQSTGQSPTVSVASDSSDALMSPSWEQLQPKDRSHTQRNDEERGWIHSVSAREKSSQSSVYWDLSGHNPEQRKSRKRRRKEKEGERSRSPFRVFSASHGRSRDARHRHAHRKHRLRPGSRSSSSNRSSSSSSSSSSADSRPDQPCPEKPSGKRKYKTRHLERAAQRQSSQKSNRDKDCRVAHSSPAKKHRGRTRERSRSPSVEIIFERHASDTPSQTHWWRRKRHKRRSRKEARVHNSPTVITIDSDSDRTNDYQDCVTEVTTDTVDYQERVCKVSSSAADDQNNDANVTNSNADSEVCVSKASCSTIDNQRSATKVTSSTTDQHHLVTKMSNSTDVDQHRLTKLDNSNTDDCHNVGKVTKSVTDCKPATEASNTATGQHRRVSDVTNSTGSPQHCVSGDSHSSVVDVTDSAITSQDSAADTVEQPVKGSDPMTGALRSEGNSSMFLSAALHSSALETCSPVPLAERISNSLDCALNLEHCVVDIVDRDSFDRLQNNTDPDQPETTNNLSRDVSMPSDTRLLESILQELEDILPEEGQGTESRLEGALTDNRVEQIEGGDVPAMGQLDSDRETAGSENTGSKRNSQSREVRPDM